MAVDPWIESALAQVIQQQPQGQQVFNPPPPVRPAGLPAAGAPIPRPNPRFSAPPVPRPAQAQSQSQSQVAAPAASAPGPTAAPSTGGRVGNYFRDVAGGISTVRPGMNKLEAFLMGMGGAIESQRARDAAAAALARKNAMEDAEAKRAGEKHRLDMAKGGFELQKTGREIDLDQYYLENPQLKPDNYWKYIEERRKYEDTLRQIGEDVDSGGAEPLSEEEIQQRLRGWDDDYKEMIRQSTPWAKQPKKRAKDQSRALPKGVSGAGSREEPYTGVTTPDQARALPVPEGADRIYLQMVDPDTGQPVLRSIPVKR